MYGKSATYRAHARPMMPDCTLRRHCAFLLHWRAAAGGASRALSPPAEAGDARTGPRQSGGGRTTATRWRVTETGFGSARRDLCGPGVMRFVPCPERRLGPSIDARVVAATKRRATRAGVARGASPGGRDEARGSRRRPARHEGAEGADPGPQAGMPRRRDGMPARRLGVQARTRGRETPPPDFEGGAGAAGGVSFQPAFEQTAPRPHPEEARQGRLEGRARPRPSRRIAHARSSGRGRSSPFIGGPGPQAASLRLSVRR